MLEFHQVPDTNILEFTLDGGMKREEFDRLAAKIEQMIEEHGKVRILEIIRNIGMMEPSAVWQDLKFSPRHMKDFTHAAVVTDQKWIEWMTAFVAPFMPAKIRFFQLAQLESARDWLRDASDETA